MISIIFCTNDLCYMPKWYIQFQISTPYMLKILGLFWSRWLLNISISSDWVITKSLITFKLLLWSAWFFGTNDLCFMPNWTIKFQIFNPYILKVMGLFWSKWLLNISYLSYRVFTKSLIMFNPFGTGHIFCLQFGSKSGIW